jgi:hypothetical protein
MDSCDSLSVGNMSDVNFASQSIVRPTLRFALVVLGVVAVSSCDGGSSKSAASSQATTTTRPTTSTSVVMTKASYVARANAICKTMNTQIAALGSPPSDPMAQAELNDKAITITTETLRKLRALPVPPGDAAALVAVYAKVDVVLADASRLSNALRSNDHVAAQRGQTKLAADSDAANAASNAYGLTVCGSS